jgi:hypothetical protein
MASCRDTFVLIFEKASKLIAVIEMMMVFMFSSFSIYKTVNQHLVTAGVLNFYTKGNVQL